jgi:hypothetical protein
VLSSVEIALPAGGVTVVDDSSELPSVKRYVFERLASMMALGRLKLLTRHRRY